MKTRTKLLFYILYAFGAVALFLFVLFPEKQIRKYAVNMVENIDPNLTFSVSEAVPEFPLGICLKQVTLSAFGEKAVYAENLIVSRSLHSLLGRKDDISFRSEVYGGNINGNLKGKRNNSQLNGAVSGIRLDNVPALKSLPYKITGELNADIEYRNGGKTVLDANLEIRDARIELPSAVIGPKFLDFIKANAGFSINENLMKIEQCEVKGPQADIVLSGIIVLRTPPETSEMKIEGFINPHLEFMRDLEKQTSLRIFPDKRPERKGFAFKMQGAIDRPVFFWN